MKWEELTSTEFKKAVKNTGVCLLTMGVIEKHGEHLPLGTDVLNGYKLACKAAEIEEAVVFPPFYFGQIYEARCFPGTVTIEPSLLLKVIQGVLDEIGRNGFKKIIIVNAHGGNTHLIRFLAQTQLWEEKPYSLYVPTERLTPVRAEKWEEICETEEHGHACECETSISLANHPELVKMEKVPNSPYRAQERLKELPPTFNGVSWYSDYPEHYVGDAGAATGEKGKKLLQLQIDTLAEYIEAVKKDEVVPALREEFFERVDEVSDLSD